LTAPPSRSLPNDFVDTLVLPADELAVRRHKKPERERGLSAQQVQRLLQAAEARKKTL